MNVLFCRSSSLVWTSCWVSVGFLPINYLLHHPQVYLFSFFPPQIADASDFSARKEEKPSGRFSPSWKKSCKRCHMFTSTSSGRRVRGETQTSAERFCRAVGRRFLDEVTIRGPAAASVDPGSVGAAAEPSVAPRKWRVSVPTWRCHVNISGKTKGHHYGRAGPPSQALP